MPAATALDTLLELATDQRDAAAVALGRLYNAHRHSQQQLDALIAYRQEYRQRLEAHMAEGLSMASLDNYRRFLTSLDGAIAHQRQALAHSEQRVAGGKHQWQDRQRRLQSYDVLATRRRDSAVRAEAKREQQTTDEFASRLGVRGTR
ncbi:flagellar export protein FliJ [Salinisphaera sp. T31B1]|uniref:flagellar export protein FliJ n=1 Tax=Salinisphaera sp. T31B1 TaxID=727963 RepID=UPI00333F992A